MSQTELTQLAKKGPIRIFMSDGRTFEIPSIDCIVVGPRVAAVLHPGSSGEPCIMLLSLSSMTSAEPITS